MSQVRILPGLPTSRHLLAFKQFVGFFRIRKRQRPRLAATGFLILRKRVRRLHRSQMPVHFQRLSVSRQPAGELLLDEQDRRATPMSTSSMTPFSLRHFPPLREKAFNYIL
jgi:hypothetical protein